MNVTLNSTGGAQTGVLMAWFDWNNDDDFADANEANSYPVSWTGIETQSFDFPINLPVPTNLFYRVRLFASAADVPAITPYLGWGGNGEVEDYYLDTGSRRESQFYRRSLQPLTRRSRLTGALPAKLRSSTSTCTAR